METKEYNGNILRLSYPAFLKVENEEPDWYAVGAKSSATALVIIDPDPNVASAFSHLIRNRHFKGIPGYLDAVIVREGDLRTTKGIVGFERIIKEVNGVGRVSWGWAIDGKVHGHYIVNLQIHAIEEYWRGGTIWEAFLNSIEVNQAYLAEHRAEDFRRQTIEKETAKAKAGVIERPQNIGVLEMLPPSLAYLLEPALLANSLSGESLEDDPRFYNALEACLKKEMHGLAKQGARARIKADREQLSEWLQQYPKDKHPETLGVECVWGALLHAKSIL